MNDPWQSMRQRLLQLLADRTIFGLEAREQEELDELCELVPGFDADCLERAAATVYLAYHRADREEPLPKALVDRIRAEASAGEASKA